MNNFSVSLAYYSSMSPKIIAASKEWLTVRFRSVGKESERIQKEYDRINYAIEYQRNGDMGFAKHREEIIEQNVPAGLTN